jgi:single-strand DNA-binding protein|tara:strand:+ start:115 stop:519 length:405 start_codon:yes stop_codon:yes gene_type:complete
MSVNKVMLLGNIGADPEYKALDYGEVCNMSLATTEVWKDKTSGEKKKRTQWHKIVIFNENLVKLTKNYCRKGDQIYVEGKLETRKYQDKQTGTDKYITEVVLRNFGGEITLCSSKPKPEKTEETTHDLEDEIPF